MRNSIPQIIIISLLISLASCSGTPEHTNTLIFATSTKFALDVSATPTSGSPEITVGYKRLEGVWMPLLANQKTGEVTIPAKCINDCKFKGTENEKIKEDTYSVLASFGADFSSGSDVSHDAKGAKVQASGGLAQFFATGIAAQNLAKEGNSKLVAINSVSSEQVSEANKQAEKAEKKAEDATNKLMKSLGAESFKKNENIGISYVNVLKAKKALLISKCTPSNKFDKTVWDAAINKSTLAQAFKTDLLAYSDLSKIEARLKLDIGMSGTITKALYDVIK